MSLRWLSDGINVEADIVKLFMIQDIATIKNKRWMDHLIKDRLVIQLNKLRPLREDSDGMSILSSSIWIWLKYHLLGNVNQIDSSVIQCIRISNDDLSTFIQ